MYFIFVLFVLDLSTICFSVSVQPQDNNVATKAKDIMNAILKELHDVKQRLGEEINHREALEVQLSHQSKKIEILESSLNLEISQRNVLQEQLVQEISQREALEVQLVQEISQREALELQLVHEISQREVLDAQLKSRIHQLEEAVSTRESHGPAYNETLGEPIKQMSQLETPIAFAVRDPQDEADDTGFEGTLLFQDIVTNLGSYYSGVTGQFTCPVSGLYLFSFNIQSENLRDGRPYAAAELRVNDVSTWYAYCEHNGSDDANMNCGATVVLQCEIASKVELYKEGYDIHISDNTWFIGFLIRPI